MKFRFSFLLAALASVAAAQQQSTPLFFVQLSDPQYGMYAKDAGFEQEQANVAFAISSINRLKPSFVIVTGDLVNKAGDRAEIAALKTQFARLNSAIPVYWVAGNHDVGNEPTPESIAAYREQFGRDYYTFDAGPIRGLVLDSSLIHAPDKSHDEAAAQERWLLAELQKARADQLKHVIVFQHHPYFVNSADEPDGYFNIPAKTRKTYLDLFRQFGVEWVFTGHLHRSAEASDGSIHMVITGPVGMPLENGRSGIRVVAVGAGISHKYFDFGALPPRLTLPLK